MKRTFLLKTVILLCALVAGSSSVWATVPTNPKWVATNLSSIIDNSTVIIISNSTTATNIALPSTTTTSNPEKKACTVSTTDGLTTITPPNGTTLQNLAWTLKKVKVKIDNVDTDAYQFYQEGSNSVRLYLNSTSSNTALRVGDASSSNDKFVLGSSSKLLKVTTAGRYVGPYDNDGTDWRTYNSETATNYKGATLTFYVLKTYTITAQSNNVDYGTVSLSNNVITGSPKSGYRYATPAYTVSSGTATVSQNGNAFTVSPFSDCTITINFEAIPSHTLSTAVSPASAGSVELGATSIKEGATTTATASAAAGYKFTSWSISGTGASLSSTTTNPTTVTMGTADAIVTANFEAVTTHAITYSVNGNETVVNVEEDAAIDLSAPASGIPAGYVFKGWRTATLTETDTDPDDYVTSATSTADITYYAVMAVMTGGTPASLTKMVKGDTFATDDKVVIVADDGTKKWAIYQETVSTSWVVKYEFDCNVSTVAANDKNWLTVSAGSDGKWKLGDATNGYLYTSTSNNLAVNTSNSSEFILDYSDTEAGFTLKTGDRWLSLRTDTENNTFRLGGNGSSPLGVGYFDIYKYDEGDANYSGYCTSVTATITLASACTDGSLYYGTYSKGTAFVVPSDLIVSEISVIDGQLVILDYETDDVVPANTGVLVVSDVAGDHTVTLTAESGTSVLGDDNMLKPSGDNGVTASDMADTDYYYYRLTMYEGKPGFWWKSDNGAGFALAANKAYLKVLISNAGTVTSQASGFTLGDHETTGVNDVRSKTEEVRGEYFNLAGQRVAQPTKGLYIVNGRKVVIK